MSEILFRYERVEPTSWAYLSALLMIALFFKFNRIFSVRNLDLMILLLLSPGLLCVKWGQENIPSGVQNPVEYVGYIWLFAVSGVLLVRSLWDSGMVRRPLLEPNMNASGMSFLAATLFLFLMANVLAGDPDATDLESAQRAQHLSQAEASGVEQQSLDARGPGFTMFYLLPEIISSRLMGEHAGRVVDAPATPLAQPEGQSIGAGGVEEGVATPPAADVEQFTSGAVVTAKVAVIISQFMIVLGMIFVGLWHFENITLGIAAATLYLLLPYTAMWTGSGTHALPGALLVWAVVNYRRPMMAGALMGFLAFGTTYYPVFLLPLWFSFYWRRGKWRLLIGIGIAMAVLILTQIFTTLDFEMFLERMRQMFGIRWPRHDFKGGIWLYWNGYYRYPVLAAFLGLSVLAMPLWPAEKNLGTLLSCSAALMIAVQFWDVHSSGVALGWYLPLLLLTIFRPNLEDRVPQNFVRA